MSVSNKNSLYNTHRTDCSSPRGVDVESLIDSQFQSEQNEEEEDQEFHDRFNELKGYYANEGNNDESRCDLH